MFATFEESPDPAKFRMKYWGAASYLQTGSKHDWTHNRDKREQKSPKSNLAAQLSAEIQRYYYLIT